MKKVLLFEVIGVEGHSGCYLSDLNAIFLSQWRASQLRVIQFTMTKHPRKTAKADRKQLPTERLFCPVMFTGSNGNLTFTQLEQREWLRFTETLT